MTDTPAHDLRSALEPCPFCGGDGLLHRVAGLDRRHRVTCKNCDAGPSGSFSAEEAIAAWNRRPLASDTIGNGGGEAAQLKSMISLVQARGIVDAIVEHCRGADFSCDMKAATKEVMRLVNVDMRTCRHQATAGLSQSQRPDLQAWQDAQSEYFDDTIIGIVTEYAEWRDAHPPAAEPVGLREELRMAYKTGYGEGYTDATDDGTGNGYSDLDAAEEGWQQYLEKIALATPARTDDAAQAGGDVVDVREFADKVMDAAHDCCIDPDAGPDALTSVSFTGEEGSNVAQAMHRLAARALPAQEVEPAATCNDRLQVGAGVKDGLTGEDAIVRAASAELAALASLIERPPHADVELELVLATRIAASIRIVLATQAACPTGAGEGYVTPKALSDDWDTHVSALTPADARKGEG